MTDPTFTVTLDARDVERLLAIARHGLERLRDQPELLATVDLDDEEQHHGVWLANLMTTVTMLAVRVAQTHGRSDMAEDLIVDSAGVLAWMRESFRP